MKQGSSDYYFLGPSVFGTVWLLGLWTMTDQQSGRGWLPVRGLAVGGLCLQLLGAGSVLSGWAGAIGDSAEQQRHRVLAQKLDALPGPTLVGERFGNLPWIQRKPPHFVYAFTYYWDRAAGKTYGREGLGGLIRRHYFKTVVLRNSSAPPARPSFDEQSLADYKHLMSEAGYDFYVLPQELAAPADSNPL
jgi:hypothetical protein